MGDEEDQFQHMVHGQFGAMESAFGQEMYQANVGVAKATREIGMGRASLLEAWATAVTIVGVMFALAMLPVIVWLWRWAL